MSPKRPNAPVLSDRPPVAKPGEPLLKALIYPKDHKIACVLMQVIYGGSSQVPQLFDTRFWETAPREGEVPAAGTAAQWRWLAKKWGSLPDLKDKS